MTTGVGPISSLASGNPPCAAQHGPHTTERNTVARGRPTRTRHVTHTPPGFSDPTDDATPSPARSGVASSSAGPDIPAAAAGWPPNAPGGHAHGTAAKKGGVSGA